LIGCILLFFSVDNSAHSIFEDGSLCLREPRSITYKFVRWCYVVLGILRMRRLSSFFFFQFSDFFICVVWFGCPALCPLFVLYYFAIVPGRRYWAFGVFPTDSVSCFCSVSLKSLLLQLDIAFLFG
jgi:hypothetical protein